MGGNLAIYFFEILLSSQLWGEYLYKDSKITPLPTNCQLYKKVLGYCCKVQYPIVQSDYLVC